MFSTRQGYSQLEPTFIKGSPAMRWLLFVVLIYLLVAIPARS